MLRGAAVALLVLLASAPAAAAEDVLVFTKTDGYRHESIPDAVATIRSLGTANGFAVTETQDAATFTPDGLARYAAVVFVSTNREVLDPAQQDALEQYVRGGGGWAGIHAASDTEYEWPFYGELLAGAWFNAHPPIQPAAVDVEDRFHPSTRGLPARWVRSDEWYAFTANPRPHARVLLRVDESSYDAAAVEFSRGPQTSAMGADHPISWCRDVGSGRAWYTAMGHTRESYAEPEMRRHLLGGILTAAGRRPADCTPRERDAPQVAARDAITRRALRRRGLPVRLFCPAGCSLRLRLRGGGGSSPTAGRRVSRVRRVALEPGDADVTRLRAHRRPPRRVRLVATVDAGTQPPVVEAVTVRRARR